jgi:hypothetical protein
MHADSPCITTVVDDTCGHLLRIARRTATAD